MQQVKLVGTPRQSIGKGPARRTRVGGLIPAIVYGGGKSPELLSLDTHDFERLLHTNNGQSVIFSLTIEGQEGQDETSAILREVQRHPVTDRLMHADLLRIDLTKEVELDIAVHGQGIPIGVKDGGILQHITRKVRVKALPLDAPTRLEVDLAELQVNHSIHVSDLKLDPKLKLLSDGETVLFVVLPPKEVVLEAAPADATAAEPEVIAKGKVAEEGEEGEAPKAGAKVETLAKDAKPDKPEKKDKK